MKKIVLQVFSLALALLMLAGCASTPVSFQWPEMEGFIEGVPALLSYSEMVQLVAESPNDPQLCRFEILAYLTPDEVEKIPSYDPWNDLENSYYSIRIIENYSSDKTFLEPLYFCFQGTPTWQYSGEPPFDKGQQLVGFLFKHRSDNVFGFSSFGYRVSAPVQEKTYLYSVAWKNLVFEELKALEIPMEEEEKLVITTYPENPQRNVAKYELSQLVSKLLEEVRSYGEQG